VTSLSDGDDEDEDDENDENDDNKPLAAPSRQRRLLVHPAQLEHDTRVAAPIGKRQARHDDGASVMVGKVDAFRRLAARAAAFLRSSARSIAVPQRRPTRGRRQRTRRRARLPPPSAHVGAQSAHAVPALA
jgi:hypothetical protein